MELSTAASPSALALLRVQYTDGTRDTYFVPLGITTTASVPETMTDRVVCHVQTPDGPGVLYDGAIHDDAGVALLASIESSSRFNTRRGTIRAWSSPAFPELRKAAGEHPPIKHGSAEQSNTSVFFGDRLMLKLYRKLDIGMNPDVEIGQYLTETGFDRIPLFAGAIVYIGSNGEEYTIALLQSAVENEGDGWGWMLDELGRYYEYCSEAGSDSTGEAIGLSLEAAATLGRRTAELHMALATRGDHPAFAPEPLKFDDLDRIIKSVRSDAQEAFDLLEKNISRLPQEVLDGATRALELREQVILGLNRFQTLEAEGSKIRIHGDYHLGQVLRTRNDYIIIDFEGEPGRPLVDRRAKASPLKDVAGMMRSFSYAAYTGLFNHVTRRPADFTRLLGSARLWERQTSSVFFENYRETAKGSSFLPLETTKLERLLDLFVMERTFYELRYELNNRPAWLRIPLQTILDFSDDR